MTVTHTKLLINEAMRTHRKELLRPRLSGGAHAKDKAAATTTGADERDVEDSASESDTDV